MKRSLSVLLAKGSVLFIDLQEEHRRDPRYLVAGFDAVLANVCALQQAARGAGIPVLHAAYIVDPAVRRPFHPVMADGTSAFSDKDSPLSALCAEVAPVGDEPVLVKSEASTFGNGELS